MTKYILLFLTLSIISCSKEYGYEVDEEVQPYFEIFEAEAELRGMTIDLDSEGIGATVDFIKDGTTVGQCQTSDQGSRRVFIDRAFWEGYDNYEKEFIVFHELGHCVLGRDHDDSADFNNKCNSIMQSGVGGCRNNYKFSTREEYLDELFNF